MICVDGCASFRVATISISYPKRVQRRIQQDRPFLQEAQDQLEKKEKNFD